MKFRPNPLLRLSAAVALACIGSAQAGDISFSSSTPLSFTDTQSYDNGTVDRIGSGTGTVVNFNSGADYTFSGNLTLTGAWNRVTLNSGASLTVNGTLSADVSGVSLNGGTLTAGALRLGDNANFTGSLNDGKQTVEWGDSVINGSTIIANQSNANFISLNNDSGFASNWLWINGDGATIDSNGFDIGNTMNTWGGGGLTKTGTGTLSLTASNQFTGNTLVSNGVLEVTSTGKLYGGGYTAGPTITVASTGTLRLNGWSWDAGGSIANLDYSRDRLVVNGGTIEYTGSSNPGGDDGTSSRNLTIGTGGATLKASSASGQTWSITGGNGNLINNNGLTLDGAGAGDMRNVIEGSGSVTKTGTGTWTLSGANTYSGNTTVSGGTLIVGSGGGIANSSTIQIANGATLDVSSATGFTVGSAQLLTGSGTVIGGITVNGTLAIGNSPGTMTFEDGLTLGATSVSDFEFTFASFSTGSYDLAQSTSGSVVFDGILNLYFDSGETYLDNTTVKIFDFGGGYSGDFDTVNYYGLGAGQSATFDATTGIVTVVPEPRAALLGSLGMLALLRRRR